MVGGRAEAFDDHWGPVEATIELDGDVLGPDATAGLGEFSPHRGGVRLRPGRRRRDHRGARHPRGRADWPAVGILAQRAKARPNRIGVTVCELLAVDGLPAARAEGLDAIDGTPGARRQALHVGLRPPGRGARAGVGRGADARLLVRSRRSTTPTPAGRRSPTARPLRAGRPPGARRPRARRAPPAARRWAGPSSFQCRGREIAGCPDTLNGGVNGTSSAARNSPCSGLSAGESNSPIKRGRLGQRRREEEVEAPVSYHSRHPTRDGLQLLPGVEEVRRARGPARFDERPRQGLDVVSGRWHGRACPTSSGRRRRPTPAAHTSEERLDELRDRRARRHGWARRRGRATRAARRPRSVAATQSGWVTTAAPKAALCIPMRSRPGIGAELLEERTGRRRRRVGIPRGRARHRVEHGRGVADGAGHGQLAHETRP